MFTSVKKENILKEDDNLNIFFPIDLHLNYPIHGIYRRRLTDRRRREEDSWRRIEEDRRSR